MEKEKEEEGGVKGGGVNGNEEEQARLLEAGVGGWATRVGVSREIRRKMRESKGMSFDQTPDHVVVRPLPGPSTVRGLLSHLAAIVGPWQDDAEGGSEQASEAYDLVKAVDLALEAEGGESGAVKQIIVHAVRREEQLRDAVGLVKVLDGHRREEQRERAELQAELGRLGGLLEREKAKWMGLEEEMLDARLDRLGPRALRLEFALPAFYLV